MQSLDTDLTRQLETERDARRREIRQAASEAVDGAEDAATLAVPTATAAFAEAREASILADQAANAARDRLIEARKELSRISIRKQDVQAPHLKLLRETADPEICKLLDCVQSLYAKPLPSGLSNERASRLQAARLSAITELRDELWKCPLDEIVSARLIELSELCGVNE